MSLEADRDYGDEDAGVVALRTGLCANPWCDDAALPEHEICQKCLDEWLLANNNDPEPEDAA